MLPTQKKQLTLYLKKIKTLQKNAAVLFVAAGIIVVGTLFLHSYPKYREVQAHQLQIAQLEKTKTEQQAELQRIERELQKSVADYELVLQEFKPVLDQVFPTQNPKDQVTEFLEDFSLSLDNVRHPMRIESVSFSSPREAGDYMVLPFRTSVEADEYNFQRFMQQIEVSGSLDPNEFYKKTTPVPILSIESINLSIPKTPDIDPALQRSGSQSSSQASVPTYLFNVEMNAYFRMPEETE